MLLTISIGSKILADGSTSGSVLVDSLTLDGERLVDVVRNIGGSGVKCYDRTTVSHTLDFEIEKTHGDEALAIYHTLMQRQSVPGTGVLLITMVDGTHTHVWRAAQCAWPKVKPSSTGISSRTSYSVECGLLTYRVRPANATLGARLRDGLLTPGNGPLPGLVLYPVPWSHPVPKSCTPRALTLAEMAE